MSGLIVDRFGTRSVLTAGFTLRIGGYLLLGVGLGVGGPDGTRLVPLVAGIAAIGVGGSLLGLSVKTLLVTEDGVEPREMLALRSTFVNIGVVAGPALGALVYPLGFGWILGACVLSHLLLGIRLTVRPVRRTAPGPRTPGKDTAARAAGDGWGLWQWLPLCLLGVAYWAIYSQLNVVMPITAERTTGSTAAISVVFIVNGALVVLCQYTLLRHVFHRAQARTLLLMRLPGLRPRLRRVHPAHRLVLAVRVRPAGHLRGDADLAQPGRTGGQGEFAAPHRTRPRHDERRRRGRQPPRFQHGRLSAPVPQRRQRHLAGARLLSLCAALTSLLLPKARAQHG